MTKKHVSLLVVFVLLFTTMFTGFVFAADDEWVEATEITINVKAHIQTFADQTYSGKGSVAFGTEGKAKRLENFNVTLEGAPTDMELVAMAHVQSFGDMPEKGFQTGVVGTSGKAKRIEGVAFKLVKKGTDIEYPGYRIAYAVHMQSFGWGISKDVNEVVAKNFDGADDFAFNGQFAGTKGLSKRIESVSLFIYKEAKLSAEISTSSANSFKVAFNRAVTDDDKVTFEVKRSNSTVSVGVEYDKAKEIATLKNSTSLPMGEYTVRVLADGEEIAAKTLTVDAQKLAKIEIASEVLSVDQSGNGYATFVAYDQYGSDVTSTYHAASINFMIGVGTASHKDGIITVKPGSSVNLMALPSVSITAYDRNTGVTATKTLKPSLSVGTISKFELLPETELIVTAGDTTTVHYIPFKAMDMSGNETKNYEVIRQGLILSGSNSDELTVTNNWVKATLVQDPKNALYAAVRVTATSSTPGSISIDLPFNITAMTKSGSVSTIPGKLRPAATVDRIVLMAPTSVVANGEYAEVPFEAFDANGNRLTRHADIAPYVNFDGLDAYSKIDGTLYLESETALSEGTHMVSAYVKKNGKYSNLSITVQKAAKAETLTVSQLDKAVEVGVTKKLGFGYDGNKGLAVKDQYGRNMDMVLGNYDYTVKVETSDSNVAAISGVTLAKGKSGITVTAAGKGSAIITCKLYDVDGTTLIATRAYPITVVDTVDIVNYTVSPSSSVIYTGGSVYATGFAITGKTISGASVELASKLVSAKPVNTVDFTSTGDKVAANASGAGYVAKDAATDVNVSVIHGGNITNLTTSIKSSTVAPVAKEISFGIAQDENKVLGGDRTFSRDTLTMPAGDFKTGKVDDLSDDGFYVEDSYGKEMTPVNYYIVSQKITGGDVTVNATGDLTFTGTPATGDYFVISAITSNGLVKTIKVVAE